MPKAKSESTNGTPPKIERYVTSLKVQLTASQLADRSDRAAQAMADRDAKEEDMKAAQKHAKSIIEELDSRIRTLLGEVRSRSTYESVDCEKRYLYADGIVQDVRLDTGEVIQSRPLTNRELQPELPFEAAVDDGEDNGE